MKISSMYKFNLIWFLIQFDITKVPNIPDITPIFSETDRNNSSTKLQIVLETSQYYIITYKVKFYQF